MIGGNGMPKFRGEDLHVALKIPAFSFSIAAPMPSKATFLGCGYRLMWSQNSAQATPSCSTLNFFFPESAKLMNIFSFETFPLVWVVVI